MIKKTRRVRFVLHGWGLISKQITILAPESLSELYDCASVANILTAYEEYLFAAERAQLEATLGRSVSPCGQGRKAVRVVRSKTKRGLSPAGHTVGSVGFAGDQVQAVSRPAQDLIDRDP